MVLQHEKQRLELRSGSLQSETLASHLSHGSASLCVDAAVCHLLGMAACGGILRGANGLRVADFCVRLGVCPVDSAELWAIYYGAVLALCMNIKNITCFSDSLEAISQAQGRGATCINNSLANLVKSMIVGGTLKELRHIKRSLNLEADTLAKAGFNIPIRSLYLFIRVPDAGPVVHFHPDRSIPVSWFLNLDSNFQCSLAHLLPVPGPAMASTLASFQYEPP